MNKTARTIETYDLCAKAFEKDFMDLKLYRDSLEHFAALLLPGASVLDLGCGPGNISKYLMDRVADLDLTGVDLSGEMVKIARENAPSGRFIKGDVRDLNFDKNSFDAIVAAFCLPYLYDAEAKKFIAAVREIVKPGGHIYISSMRGETSGFETAGFTSGKEIFVNYYTEDFMKTAFDENGLAILKQIDQDYPEPDGSVTIDMIFILQKSGTGI